MRSPPFIARWRGAGGRLVAGLALLYAAAPAGAITYTWTGNDGASGYWSSSANWDASGVPVSADACDLVFSANPNGFVSSNNLAANPFVVNSLTFGGGLAAPFTLSNTNPIQFSFIASQTITQNATAKVTLAGPINFKTTNRDLKFTGSGLGDIEITGIFYFPHQSTMTVDSTFTNNVIINQIDFWTRSSFLYNNMPTATGKEWRYNGPLRFTAANDPTTIGFYGAGRTVINGQFMHVGGAGGGVDFNPGAGGWVVLSNAAGNFADATDITFGNAGGTTDLGGYTHTVRNATFYGGKVTNGVLAVQNFYLDYGTVNVPITNAAGYQANLVKRPITNNDSWINTTCTHNGVTRLIASDITLQGPNGSANQAAVEFDMAPLNGENSSLILDSSGANNNDRLSDTRSVTMKSGRLILIGNAAVPTTEVIGDLTFSRYAQICVDARAGGVASLTGNSITRSDYGTLFVSGDSLGSAAGPNVSQVKFTSPPALTAGSLGTTGAPLVPWAAADAGYLYYYGQPVTYDVNGFRPLTASEYVVNAVTPNVNVFITASNDMGAADVTVKSLTMRPPANGNYWLTGSGSAKLTITDGVLVSGKSNQEPNNFIMVPYLTFGPNAVCGYEGIIHSFSGLGTALTLDSAIVDNGANAVSLTKSGPYAVRLRGMNVIGGTLRVNEGIVYILDNPDTGATVESTTVRDVSIIPGQTTAIDIGAGGRLNTTGTGTVVRIFKNLGGAALTGSGTLGLSGDVRVEPAIGGATLTVAPAIDLGAATRTLDIPDGTPSPDAAFDGGIGGGGGLIKAGAGVMSLKGAGSYGGPTTVSAGSLYLQNAGGSIVGSSGVTVNRYTLLYLDSSSANNNDRIGDIPVALNDATLKVTGNASVPTTEHIGTLSCSGLNMISIDPKAGGVAKLTAAGLNRVDRGFLVIAGYSLGSAAGANVGQVALDSAPTLVGSGASGTPTVGVYPLAVGSGRAADWGSRWTGPPDYGSLVTYDSVNGSFRVLNRSTEFVTTPTAAGSDNNVFGSGTITADKTINSFMSNGHSIGGNAGTMLTIMSGLIDNISGYDPTTISAPYLTFGNNAVNGCEGIVYTYGWAGSSGRTEISSVIKDNGANAVSLTIAGQGPTILKAANTYSGPTTVNSGTLRIDAGHNRLPTNTTVAIYSSGVFDLYGRTQAVAGVTGSGLITNTSGTLATLILNMASNLTYSGSIAGNVNVIKNGAGTLTMTGGVLNCSGSLTVNEGTLAYDARATNGNFSSIAVRSGATLGVLGGTLNAANATFDNGATLSVTLTGTNVTDAGMLRVSGSLAMDGGARLAVRTAPGVTPLNGQSWFVVEAPAIATVPRPSYGYMVQLEPGSPNRLRLRVGTWGTMIVIQ